MAKLTMTWIGSNLFSARFFLLNITSFFLHKLILKFQITFFNKGENIICNQQNN